LKNSKKKGMPVKNQSWHVESAVDKINPAAKADPVMTVSGAILVWFAEAPSGQIHQGHQVLVEGMRRTGFCRQL
jgi:hypothetical protein